MTGELVVRRIKDFDIVIEVLVGGEWVASKRIAAVTMAHRTVTVPYACRPGRIRARYVPRCPLGRDGGLRMGAE
jgi:hypothetical protein